MIDYGVPVPSQLFFDVGISGLCTNIMTTNDEVYEDNESFTVSLSSTSSNVDVSGSIATVLITNNDGIKILYNVVYMWELFKPPSH